MTRYLAAASALALGAIAAPVSAETVLRYSQWLPPSHMLRVNVIDPYLERWAEVTGGEVRVEATPSIVGTLPGQFDAARDGLVDIVFIINGYTPGRLDLTQVAELPFLGDTAEANSVAFWRVYKDHLEEQGEFRGTVPLVTFTHGPGALYLTEGTVTSLDQLDGKKIRVGSESVGRTIGALGGVPVQTPLSEIYESLSTGVVDGTAMNLEAAKNFGLIEVLPHATTVPGGIYNLTMSILINEASWNALSEKDRAAIMEISGEPLARELGVWQDRSDEAAREALLEAGSTVEEASPELIAAMEEAVQPVYEQWFARAREKGLETPEDVLDAFRAELEKIESGM